MADLADAISKLADALDRYADVQDRRLAFEERREVRIAAGRKGRNRRKRSKPDAEATD